MDNRIGSQRPIGPLLGRRLGDRSGGRERPFVLPRRPSKDGEAAEEEGAAEESSAAEDSTDSASTLHGTLSPQPPADGRFAVSRERLEDEAGQRIDLRG